MTLEKVSRWSVRSAEVNARSTEAALAFESPDSRGEEVPASAGVVGSLEAGQLRCVSVTGEPGASVEGSRNACAPNAGSTVGEMSRAKETCSGFEAALVVWVELRSLVAKGDTARRPTAILLAMRVPRPVTRS